MTAPLREQLQMARINRTKRRVHLWWHANRCPSCMQRAAVLNAAMSPVDGLSQVLAQIGATVEFVRSDEDDAHPVPPKAH